jgi:hypothetical protein
MNVLVGARRSILLPKKKQNGGAPGLGLGLADFMASTPSPAKPAVQPLPLTKTTLTINIESYANEALLPYFDKTLNEIDNDVLARYKV